MEGVTSFDIIVLIIVGVGAVGGLLRGFVQEILSLFAWILAIFAVHTMHSGLTAWFYQHLSTQAAAAVLSFALLLLIPYAGMKLVAGMAGKAVRASLLGPLDRLLGLGFGTIKGIIIVVMAFSILVLGFDTVWGVAGRPVWITTARSYEFVNAASSEMVELIKQRGQQLAADDKSAKGT